MLRSQHSETHPVNGTISMYLKNGEVAHFYGTKVINKNGGLLLMKGNSHIKKDDIEKIEILFNDDIIIPKHDLLNKLHLTWFGY